MNLAAAMNVEPPMEPKSRPSWMPLAFSAVLVVGIWLGMGMESGDARSSLLGGGERGRLVHILDRIEATYVDPVMREELEAVAVEAILEELDPHSYYFSEEELMAMAEPMEGNFEGVGIEFIIQDDTLMVLNAIAGGPSEAAGIAAGDRIVRVDTAEISGPSLNNAAVMKLLKGPRGTEVRLGLLRRGTPYEVSIERDRIPIHSVVAALPIGDETGYIKCIRFAQNTELEFREAMDVLTQAGCNKVIVDLRGNGGGYLNAVIPMVEGFLDDGLPIVFTEGIHSPRRNYESHGRGPWADWQVAVLIDESSASASEIFAGAIQDNDRGVVVGRRSFGKGLVQEEFGIPDAGALRLTVARFHTPTGRAIQKPYGSYEDDFSERYERGELFHEDSIPAIDSLRYETPKGRIVYGGGGIAPDFFVGLDTSVTSEWLGEVNWWGLLRDAAFEYVDNHRVELMGVQVDRGFHGASALELLLIRAEEWGVVGAPEGPEELELVEQRLWAQIVRNLKGESAYYAVLLEDDSTCDRAVQLLRQSSEWSVVDGRLVLASESVNNDQSTL
jgi:carboxyl-terminal processing protease